MKWIFVGLGNPGEEYHATRHNVGRMIVDEFRAMHTFSSWHHEKKVKALVSEGKIEREDVLLATPETFMNKSGESVRTLVKSPKAAERLVVVHDDIDMPLGSIKIVFGRGAGGNRGVASVIRSLKTKAFIRVRIGVLPTTPSGKPKKPKGDQKVLDLIMSPFSKKEEIVFEKVVKRAVAALETIVREGRQKAMNEVN